MKDYELKGYNSQQLRQIEDGLNNGVDITGYVDPRFDWMQMEQIKLGLIEDLDVSIYADASIPASQMEHIREKRKIESGRTEIQEHEIKQTRIRSWAWRFRLAAILLFIAIVGFYGWHYYSLLTQPLFIEFTEPEVTIEYGQTFLPSKYIKDYTETDNVELVMPESMKMDAIGDQTMIYQIKNGYKTETFELTVHIVDTQAPVITLNTHDVTLTKGEEVFAAKAYIVNASDNVDGDITDQIHIDVKDDQIDQTVVYSSRDSSGNESTEKLELHWKDPPEPEVVYIETPVYINESTSTGSGAMESTIVNENNHGTQNYMFADGYDLDSGYSACAAAMSAIGQGTCIPLTNDQGLYIGYQLNY